MRYLLTGLAMALCTATSAHAQISIGIGLPSIEIGINMPVYPELVLVPGYPVYYDPQASSNYFFYDGVYWVYQGDSWYVSSWYNGPWQAVGPQDVPEFVLRVPVRYYRQPPAYFRGWRPDDSPRWGEHWGHDWEQRRRGWDQWDHRSAPPPAPLPVYQRQYSGDRYPRAVEQQHAVQSEHYRYQPREAVTQQHFKQLASPGGARAEPRQQAPAQQRSPARPEQAAPGQQRQQPQQTQQREPMPAQQMQQHPQAAPQGRGQEKKAEPQGRAPESRAEPQGRAPESRAAPQGKGEEKKAAPQGKGQEKKNEERGQDRP